MEICPLTSAQKRLWVEWKLNPKDYAYNLNLVFKLTGNLNIELLTKALNLIIEKQETFRTYFVENAGEPFQVILPSEHKIFNDNYLHLIDLEFVSIKDGIAQSIKKETCKPFDLMVPFPYRFCLIRETKEIYCFIVTIHHIISDGTSLELFINELSTLYNNTTTFAQYLSTSTNKLKDYIVYSNTKVTTKNALAVEYWRNVMEDLEPVINFHAINKGYNNKSKNSRFILEQELIIKLKELATNNNTTVFVILITTFGVLLYRYFNSKDLSIGYAVNIRPKEFKKLFGFYVNNIPLKIKIEDNLLFSELLKLVATQRNNDREYQDLSLQEIIKTIKNKNNTNNSVPFNVSFAQVSFPTLGLQRQQGLSLKDVKVEPIPINLDRTHFDLSFLYAELDEQFEFSVDYKTDIFDDKFINQMITHFIKLLQEISNNPEQYVYNLPLLTTTEQEQTFNQLKGEFLSYPTNETPIELFETQVKLLPNFLAVVHNNIKITYKELNEKANQLAHFLLQHNITSGSIIAIKLERSLEYIVSILGIMKAKCTYVPLDPNYPMERIKFILQETEAKFLIVREKPEEQNDYTGKIFAINKDWNELLELPTSNPQLSYEPTDLAYIIYTSGSTGTPKGVKISNYALLNLIFWHKNAYLRGNDHKISASVIAGEGFDASVWEIWPYLATGAALHIADKDLVLNTEALIQWLGKEKINISFLPTPIMEIFLKQVKNFTLPHLSIVLTGGEQLKIFPSVNLPFKIFNHYGPTENTVVTTQANVLPLELVHNKITMPAIGKPITNVFLYVLDQNKQPVPTGVVGELYIAGSSLADGYVNPNLTTQNFIPNPFTPNISKWLYKTGDLVRLNFNAELDFISRTDSQIKLRGFRIELTEVEMQLLKYPAIAQCVVLLQKDQKQNNYLVAYFVAKAGVTKVETNIISNYLSKILPEYMIPSQYISINKMPLTLNGKIDKQALLELSIDKFDDQNKVQPRNKIEKKLLQIWSKVLGNANIGIFDNFFALGGHSLLVSSVILAIKKYFSIDLPFRSFFENPTIANLAKIINTTNNIFLEDINNDPVILKREIILDENIKVTTKPTAVNNLQNLLLTGATGFLGAFLLVDLFNLTNTTIHCLIRASNLDEAHNTLSDNLLQYGLDPMILTTDRVQIIIGDLSKPKLGIDNDIYEVLLEKIDSIYHCGAQVHHIYSYNMLEATNVFGTIEIIKFAACKKHKHIHYVSAVSAARQNLDAKGFVVENFLERIPPQADIEDGYNQTKLASELLLTTAYNRGLSVHIYRPAWIAGHSRTGVCALKNQHLFLLIKGCIQLGYAPLWDMELNIVPVDFTSKFITLVSTDVGITDSVFNLINPKIMFWENLIQWINKYGYKVELIPKIEWQKNHLYKIRKDNALFPLIPLYIGGETSKHTQKQIQSLKVNNTNTLMACRIIQLPCHEIDNEMLECYFKFLQKTKFIPTAKKVNKKEKMVQAYNF